MAHRAGFVNIIGSPNVGKSTLMNGLVGEKLSIITSKAQTTRHRIMGIVNGDDFQIVYSDTPGVLEPNYKLHESMMRFVHTAFADADIVLFMTDPFEKGKFPKAILERIQKMEVPKLILINKIDLTDQEKLEELSAHWKEVFPDSEVLPVSALHKFGLEQVIGRIRDLLPESPPFFPKDELTDKPMRFFVSEIIREKIFLNYKKEVPYSCEVAVESYKDDGKMVRIRAVIYVARDSQKGIIIGHKGAGLKRVGTGARKDIEAFIEKKVFLELHVKVEKNWRDKDQKLRQFGYNQK